MQVPDDFLEPLDVCEQFMDLYTLPSIPSQRTIDSGRLVTLGDPIEITTVIQSQAMASNARTTHLNTSEVIPVRAPSESDSKILTRWAHSGHQPLPH